MKRAFTLIELLVVIAIIAILAAILFPVFVQAKVSAKFTVCISNMKQVSAALALYQADFDDTYPAAVQWEPLEGFAPQKMWIGYDNNNGNRCNSPYNGFYGEVDEPAIRAPRPGAIDPYIKNEGIKKCPGKPQEWQMALAANNFSPGIWSAYYSDNPDAEGNEWGPMSKEQDLGPESCVITIGAKATEVEKPATTLIVWEHKARVPMCNFMQNPYWFDQPPDDDLRREHFNFLHRGAAATLWGDGHAQRITYGQLRRPYFSSIKSIYPNE